jgi:VWFA-related protein
VRDLNEAFSQIADDLRQQYEISYYPTYAAHDGSYRHIRLQVDRSGVNVRARPGYQSAKTNQRSPQGGGVFAKNNR